MGKSKYGLKNPFKGDLNEQVKEDKKKVKVDRSAYNCLPCGGDGLVGEKICDVCQGTGKSSTHGVGFPEGTYQLRPNDGAYVVKNGEWVKQ